MSILKNIMAKIFPSNHPDTNADLSSASAPDTPARDTSPANVPRSAASADVPTDSRAAASANAPAGSPLTQGPAFASTPPGTTAPGARDAGYAASQPAPSQSAGTGSEVDGSPATESTNTGPQPDVTATGPGTTATPSGGPDTQGATSAAISGTAFVDVEAVLRDLQSRNPQQLNWKTSIVDLLKLLGLDSSFGARKELASELHYTGSTEDSAAMNVWLHQEVMRKLAQNGGKLPDDLKN